MHVAKTPVMAIETGNGKQERGKCTAIMGAFKHRAYCCSGKRFKTQAPETWTSATCVAIPSPSRVKMYPTAGVWKTVSDRGTSSTLGGFLVTS